MKNKFLCLTIFILCLSACKEEPKEIAITEVSEEQKIDSLAIRYHELGRFSGSILVAENDSVIFFKSYGLADYDSGEKFSDSTAFKLGSLSEFFTEAIFVDMADEGLIDVDEKASVYLPEITKDFTVRELLTHTSGLPDVKTVKEANPDAEYSTIKFANLAESDPEKNASRSDLGYNILGLIIEKVNKKTFQEAMEQYSAEWNLENTYLTKTNSENEAKGYLFGNFQGQGMELVEAPKYEIEEAFSSDGLKAGIFDVLKLSQISKRNTIEQNDYLKQDGFSYSLSKDEQAGLTVVVLSNRRHPVANEISNSVRAIYKNEPYKLPLPKKEVPINTSMLEEYAGSYILNPGMRLKIITANDSLYLLMGDNKLHLKPQSETQFFLEESDATIEFVPNFNNTVSSAILYDGFLEGIEIAKVAE